MTSTPVSSPSTTDHGDDVARRFRYQHAYGVILWAAAYKRDLRYVALWCEQHEDFLGEISENEFEAIQVKTRNAELGYWEFSDEEVFTSIGRFIQLDALFPGQFRRFHFVSNAQCSDSAKRQRKHLCPVAVLKACQQSADRLPEFCETALTFLAAKTGSNRDAVLSVLKRTDVDHAPSLEQMDDAVRQRHLSTIDGLGDCSTGQLTQVFDLLLSRIRDASSLASDSPARDYSALRNGLGGAPELAHKRVPIADLASHVEHLRRLGVLPACRALGGRYPSDDHIKYYLLDRVEQHESMFKIMRESHTLRRNTPSALRTPHAFCLMGMVDDALPLFTDRVCYDTLHDLHPDLDQPVTDVYVSLAPFPGASAFDPFLTAVREVSGKLNAGAFPFPDDAAAREAAAFIRHSGPPTEFVQLPAVRSCCEHLVASRMEARCKTVLALISQFDEAKLPMEFPQLLPYWKAFWATVMSRDEQLDVLIFVAITLERRLWSFWQPRPLRSRELHELPRPELVRRLDIEAWIRTHLVKDLRWVFSKCHKFQQRIEADCDLKKGAPMQHVVNAAISATSV